MSSNYTERQEKAKNQSCRIVPCPGGPGSIKDQGPTEDSKIMVKLCF